MEDPEEPILGNIDKTTGNIEAVEPEIESTTPGRWN